jgi:hypothetical protein
MAKPKRDFPDIVRRVQCVHGAGVAQNVGGHALPCDGRPLACGLGGMDGEDVLDRVMARPRAFRKGS